MFPLRSLVPSHAAATGSSASKTQTPPKSAWFVESAMGRMQRLVLEGQWARSKQLVPT
ncbi:MAG TPA: hypothetical protein DEB46_01205 [Myxococcales bacterium]|nr:hypothetical protein [Myxococcales bacterium]